MRGEDQRSEGIFSYVRLEQRIPADHPLRVIRDLVDAALQGLSRDFSKLYARDGRPSIAPERVLRALLLQAFFTVRSERQLMEQLDYNLLFRWFVGLSMDDLVWDATVFCKNRDRLLDGDVAAKFFAAVLNLPQVRKLLSSEHFSVDGTLIEAWASMKSFVPKEGGDSALRPWRQERAQCRARLPWREAQERHAFLDHRPRCPAVPQGGGQGGQALSHGTFDDGEPQRAPRRCAPEYRSSSLRPILRRSGPAPSKGLPSLPMPTTT
jgi:transposase